ncbi:MAG: ABC transporter ATP-binding protein [Bdellovibrionota bacterium]
MIACTNLSVSKKEFSILNHVNINIPDRSFYTILGPNGSGKTTLLKCICGLNQEYSGTIKINKEDAKTFDEEKLSKNITWIPEHLNIPFEYTALELTVLGRFPWHQGHPKMIDYEKAIEALAILDLQKKQNQSIQSMSSGEQKKTLLARALASEAEIIILDEPLANLDLAAAKKVCNIFRKLSEEGKTIVASLHDLSLTYRFATHCAFLKAGILVSSGVKESVFVANNIENTYEVNVETVYDSNGLPHLIY